jgi:hypothetical protein
MPVENISPQYIPHGEIWPPKITGKIRFFTQKQLRNIALTAFSILLFTETMQPSGFFLKKRPPSMLS